MNEAQRRFHLDGVSVLSASQVDELFADGDYVRAISTAPRFRLAGVTVRLPRAFDRGLRIESMGVEANVTPRDLAGSGVEWAQHIAVYPDVAPGVHAFRRVTVDGVEDLYQVESPGTDLTFAYDVALEGVAGLRLVADTLELLDASGSPRLRSTAPVVVDSRGNSRVGTLKVSGCAYDTSPHGPWGRAPTAPGASTCTVTVHVDGRGLAYPVLVDPSWIGTLNTKQSHAYHTMVVLTAGVDAGKVLLLGGNGTAPGTTELFNPAAATPSWATGSVIGGTFAIGARAVITPNGTVVISGGLATDTSTLAQKTVFVRNPTTGAWSGGAAMSASRAWHTMQVIKAGTPLKDLVLVAGGQTKNFLSSTAQALASAEIYDPDPVVDAWKVTGPLNAPRSHQGSVTMGDGKVIVAGGSIYSPSAFGEASIATVEVYDPAAGTWAAKGSMASARAYPALASLGGSKVLITGGFNASALAPFDTLEYFDGTALSTLTAKLTQPRYLHTATTLPDGRVLITGGDATTDGSTAMPTASADLFLPGTDPTTGTVASTASMASVRQNHAAVSLGAKGVLVTGGQIADDGTASDTAFGSETTTSEIYDLTLGATCATSATCPTGLTCVDSVCCNKPSCATGEKCNAPGHEGVCTKPKGATCTSNTECATGFCVTGVCCEGACGGGCKTCSETGKLGTCVLAKPGTDPGGYCGTTSGGGDCSAKCDSLGTCSLTVPTGTACGASAPGDAGTDSGGGSFCKRYACSDFGTCDLTTFNCGLSCTTTVTCNEPTKTCTPIASGIKAGFCVIAGECWSYGDIDPKDATKCRVCDPPTSKIDWTTAESCIDAGPDSGVFDAGTPDDTGSVTDTAAGTDSARDTGSADASSDATVDTGGAIGDIGEGKACSCETPGSQRPSGTNATGAAALLGLGFVIGRFVIDRRRRKR